MAIGGAHRICSLPLQMDASPHDDNYISTAQRCGLLYHVQDNIPSPNAYAIQRYDGADAAAHLEGAEVLSILAHLLPLLELRFLTSLAFHDIGTSPMRDLHLQKLENLCHRTKGSAPVLPTLLSILEAAKLNALT